MIRITIFYNKETEHKAQNKFFELIEYFNMDKEDIQIYKSRNNGKIIIGDILEICLKYLKNTIHWTELEDLGRGYASNISFVPKENIDIFFRSGYYSNRAGSIREF